MDNIQKEPSLHCEYCGSSEIHSDLEKKFTHCYLCGALTYRQISIPSCVPAPEDSNPSSFYLIRQRASDSDFLSAQGLKLSGPTHAWGDFIDGGRLLGKARRACVEFSLSRPLFGYLSLKIHLASLGTFVGQVVVCFENHKVYAARNEDVDNCVDIDIPKALFIEKTKLDVCFYVEQEDASINQIDPVVLVKDVQLFALSSRLDSCQVIDFEDIFRIDGEFKIKFCTESQGRRRGFEDLRATRLLNEVEYYEPEEFGVWFSKTQNLIKFVVDGFHPKTLHIVLVSPFVGQECQLILNNKVIKEITFDSTFVELSVDLTSIQTDGLCLLGIEFTRNYNLKEMGLNDIRIMPGGIASLGLN